ncbi:unnamed protein product [Didymodactylos carnosus]|uniref:EF-hand domain-containing protein n=2 Tax=Didymodactylos carnosus TaxID=1234261 RepID=A0A815VDU4_9BILA|nr:unnamed protein product [Didymodactylos carnosus]CAF4390952.1 unnamed protein product [Didymodactylos carnosus]
MKLTRSVNTVINNMGNYISWLIDMGSRYLLGTAPKPIKPKILSNTRLDKLAQITGLKKEQVKEWHEGFIKDCPAGKLNKKKFIEVYKQFFPTANSEKFSEYVFKTFDTDGSGEVDFDEFLIAISLTAKRDPKQKLEWAFSMYDAFADASSNNLVITVPALMSKNAI